MIIPSMLNKILKFIKKKRKRRGGRGKGGRGKNKKKKEMINILME